MYHMHKCLYFIPNKYTLNKICNLKPFIMKKFTIIFIIIGLQFSGFSQQIIPSSIIHDGIQREYLLYVPSTYTGNSPVPLVLNFHGYTSNYFEQFVYGNFTVLAETANFIIALPQGTKDPYGLRGWNVGKTSIQITEDDIGFVEALIEEISNTFSIDKKRVYSTGMSNGGDLSYILACQLSDKIAAIAPVAGAMVMGAMMDCNALPQYPTPILIIHGTEDPSFLAPYDGNNEIESVADVMRFWVNNNHANNKPTVTSLPDIEPNDGSTVEHIIYDRGAKRSSIEHFKILGGGHTWPGAAFIIGPTNMDIDASEEIWKFFSRYDINGLIDNRNVKKVSSSARVQYYPNPFAETIKFSLEAPQNSNVELRIYNANGVQISKGLTYNEYSDGIHEVNWKADGNNDGFYYFKLFVDGKMLETTSSNKIFKSVASGYE